MHRIWSEPLDYFAGVLEKNGDVVNWENPMGSTLLVADPKLIKQIFALDNKSIIRSEAFTKFYSQAIGVGVATTNSPEWLPHRQACTQFMRAADPTSILNVTNEHLDLWLDSLVDAPLNLNAETKIFSLKLMAKILFDLDISSAESATAINAAQSALTAAKNASIGSNEMGVSEASIHWRALAIKWHTQRLSESGITVGSFSNMLVAAYDSLSAALTWTWAYLASYPQLINSVRRDGDQAKYAFMESMRLQTPFWISSRQSCDAIQLESLFIPAGQTIFLLNWHAHRSAKYWPSPLEFKPQRFADPSSNAHVFFNPFGAGPRVCPGAQLSLKIGPHIIQKLLQQFDPVLVSANLPKPDATHVVHPHGGLWCYLRTRQSEQPIVI